jgi:hypothetical protein
MTRCFMCNAKFLSDDVRSNILLENGAPFGAIHDECYDAFVESMSKLGDSILLTPLAPH